ncbi:hypothetical protein [Sulfuracidifex metallicus]|uniref:hypothetical protein n=1 Tax=Sulfuracidifex metallicus TaxID=47303 RepID=UPI002275375B|nr:hypothetical protein [Sulfuracidifex metallicus]MCY0851041.1 hypothetical protein [Sulfuracidifex metallicus]
MSYRELPNGDVWIGDGEDDFSSLSDFHILWFGAFFLAIAIVLVVMSVPNDQYWVLFLFAIYVTGVTVDLWVHQFIH